MDDEEIRDILKSTKLNIPFHIQTQILDTNNEHYGLKFFYENAQDNKTVDEGGLNLSITRRPWPTFEVISKIRKESKESKDSKNNSGSVHINKYTVSGIEAFNSLIYKPNYMYEFIYHYFIKPYTKDPERNPFMYSKDYKFKTIQDLKLIKYELAKHQKFCAQFISTMTDFNGLLVYHGLGSGKTVTALAIAEANKASYINDRGTVTPIEGRNKACTVTIAIPKNLLKSYFDELKGDIENGALKSRISTCVIYTDIGDGKGYRQYYTGTVKKNNLGQAVIKNGLVEYEDTILGKLQKAEQLLLNYEKRLNDLNKLYEVKRNQTMTESERTRVVEEIRAERKSIEKRKTDLQNIQIKSLKNDLKSRVSSVYFIVSIGTFISRLYKQGTASDILLGRENWSELPEGIKYGTSPHPDCFHSKNGIVIFDEIHKYVGENTERLTGKGSNHKALYDITNIYTRLRDGFPAMKIIALTATPIFDKPSELGKILNLLRVRIPFPDTQAEYEKWFVKVVQDSKEVKNTILYKYMTSGYVSYFKGGNPNGYPYRRNHLIVTPITGIQAQHYVDGINKAVAANKGNKKTNKKLSGHIMDLTSALPKLAVSVIGTRSTGDQDYYRAEAMYKEMQYIMRTTGSIKNVSDYFKERAVKLHSIAHQIMNSTGNVFVHSLFVARGLMPLAYYLMIHGYTLLDKDTVNVGGPKSFGIYSSKASEFFGLMPEKEYKDKLLDLFNEPANKDSSKCRIILGLIEEGISFKNVMAVYVVGPWWNNAKLEQIIARAIRYLSHDGLPADRQYVDVYYYTAVNQTYPAPDDELKYPFSVRTLDQTMYLVANNKDKLATKFELLTKEAAVDHDLNTYGNLSRLEEMIIYDVHKKPKFSVMYNRSNGKYYTVEDPLLGSGRSTSIDEVNIVLEEKIVAKERPKAVSKRYDSEDEDFTVEDLFSSFVDEQSSEEKSKDEEESIGNKDSLETSGDVNKIDKSDIMDIEMINKTNTVWPPIAYSKTTGVLKDYVIKITEDNLDRKMVSVITPEIISNFNKNTNMDFFELMNYAVKHGEDQEIWDKALENYKKSKLLSILIGMYDIHKMDPKSQEMKNFISKNVNMLWNHLPVELKKTMPYYKEHLRNIESIVQDQNRREYPEIARRYNSVYGTHITENDINTKEKLGKFDMDQVKFIFESISKKVKTKA